jgi:hypothetical protein
LFVYVLPQVIDPPITESSPSSSEEEEKKEDDSPPPRQFLLHRAALACRKNMCELLISFGIPPSCKNNEGKTALDVIKAVIPETRFGRKETLEYLLSVDDGDDDGDGNKAEKSSSRQQMRGSAVKK